MISKYNELIFRLNQLNTKEKLEWSQRKILTVTLKVEEVYLEEEVPTSPIPLNTVLQEIQMTVLPGDLKVGVVSLAVEAHTPATPLIQGHQEVQMDSRLFIYSQ